MSAMATYVTTRGAVYVHTAPIALCPHITWAMETVLGTRVRLDWTPQPRDTSSLRTEASWTGEPGTGARLTSALRACGSVRFDVVEEPSPGSDGSRWSFTPTLGIHHCWVSVNGDSVIHEDRLRLALLEPDPQAMRSRLEEALGSAWDRELEPYRHAGDGATVRWLHRVS